MLSTAARRVGARTCASFTTRCATRAALCSTRRRRTTSLAKRGRLPSQESPMSRQIKPFISPEEYLALERKAEYKSEYLNGEIFAMTGASRKHNLIATNIVTSLSPQLRARPCEVYASDMRLKVVATGLYTYPDVVVVCREPRLEDDYLDTLLNPT